MPRMTDEALGALFTSLQYDRSRPPLKAVQITRVSRKSQVDGTSLEGQDEDLARWAVHNNVEVIRKYEAPGESAWRGDRQVIHRVLADLPELKRQGVQLLVVWVLDRFARNARDCLNFIEEFRTAGVAVVPTMGFMDYSTPEGWRFFVQEAAAAEYYSHRLSRTMKSASNWLVEHGVHVGPVPLGYHRPGKRQPLEPTDGSQQIVQLFTLYATGQYTFATLADAMNDQGHRVWNVQKQQFVAFTKWSIAEMLHNSTYIGKIRYHGKEYAGQHTPIIDLVTWGQVQAILQQRGSKRGRTVVSQSRGRLVELMRCEFCNSRLWQKAYNRASNMLYYECSGQWQCDCKARMVREDRIWEQVMGLLSVLQLPIDWQQEVLAKAQALLDSQQAAPPRGPESDPELAPKLERLLDLYMDGGIDKETYQRRRAELEAAHPPRVVQSAAPLVLLDMAQALRWLSNLHDLVQDAPLVQQRILLQQLFTTLWVSKQNGLVAVQPRQIYIDLVRTATSPSLGMVSRVGVQSPIWEIPLRRTWPQRIVA